LEAIEINNKMNFFNFSKSEFKISEKFLLEKDWEGKEGFAQEDDLRPAELRFRLGRLNFLRLVVIICFFILGWRVFSLQILAGESYTKEAENNRIRTLSLAAPRGVIYDQKGDLLVRNVPNFEVAFVPADLPPIPERGELIKDLAGLLGKNPAEIESAFNASDPHSYEPKILVNNLGREQALILDTKLFSLPGISLLSSPVREYLGGELVSHIVGYTGRISPEEYATQKEQGYFLTDYIGKQGVEYFYESLLKGKNGREIAEVNSRGQIDKIVGQENPEAGRSLQLSLDLDLEKKIEEEVKTMLAQTKTEKAAVVAMDPESGRILALVSLPFYDNNLFAKGISEEKFDEFNRDPNQPLFDRAISGEYPPGSTIKPLIAVAGLEEKVITPNKTISCPGSLIYQGWGGTIWNFPDWKAHGTVDVKRAIAESCDVFFYIVGGGKEDIGIQGLGIDRIKAWAEKFGLNNTLGVDLPGEAAGLIPDIAWKEKVKGEDWYIGDTYHTSIGQGDILVTPLQLTNYIATIANGGILYKPKIGYKIIDEIAKTETEIPPEIIRKDFISSQTIETVRQGMRQTVTSGSARLLNSLPVAVAGKTGTAQFGAEKATHAWFTCFAPYDHPKIALTVLVEGGGDGEKVAAPIAKNVLEWYFNKK